MCVNLPSAFFCNVFNLLFSCVCSIEFINCLSVSFNIAFISNVRADLFGIKTKQNLQ